MSAHGLVQPYAGRGMPDELLPTVELVSEIRKVKHRFDNGIRCREGMEYQEKGSERPLQPLLL